MDIKDGHPHQHAQMMTLDHTGNSHSATTDAPKHACT